MSLKRLFASLSLRLQMAAIFLSFVGFAFGVKTYLHVKEQFGEAAAQVFYADLQWQLVIAVIVNVAVAVVLYQITTKPIKNLSQVMRDLTSNNLDVEVPYTHQSTEIGGMARKVDIFKQNAVEKLALEERQKETELKMRDEKKKAMADLARRFEERVQVIIHEVAEEVQKAESVSERMTTIMNENSRKTSAAVSGAEHASSNVGAVASAAEQISSSIREMVMQMDKSGQSVKAAVLANQSANEVAAMLGSAADKIGEIVNLIQSIAGQINLLALNATIESARAGEAGRGFAVVANEVKTLAAQTGKATDEISGQIANIQEVARQVMGALSTISTSVQEVDTLSTAIAAAIHQQNAATGEIANNIASAATRTKEISSEIVDVNTASGTASACAADAMKAVQALSTNTDRLREAMDAFLQEVRAA